MTLYVHGIPKSTCTPRDIVNIFNSVAQVKHVEINQEKGRAQVELYDKASTSFVLSKKWRINGSELHVYVMKSEPSIKDRKHKRSYDEKQLQSANIINARMNTEIPYQLYRRNANSFWADIPHHESRIKPKKAKMKFCSGIPKRTFMEYEVNRCNNYRKLQRWKKKASKVNWKLARDPYSSLNLDEFNSYIDDVIKEISRSKVIDKKRDSIPGNRSQSTEEKLTEKELTSIDTPIPQMKCTEETAIDSHVIPVCVLFKQKLNVIWFESFSMCLIELKEKIKAKIGIPPDLQMLLHKGKILNPKCLLRFAQYETIQVLIKGKGGMQTSETGISRSSSEKDVELWLKREVGLKEEIFNKFCTLSELDGETLYSYNRDNVNAFKSETDIPVGIARKILAFRDKTYEGISNPLLGYTPEQISVFVKKSLCARDESIGRLCQNIVERHIDGFVFYNYTDEKEFQSDFHDLNIKGIYFRKVFLKRNAEFEILNQGGSPASPEDMLAPAHSLPSKPIQEEHSSCDSSFDFVRYPVQEAQSNKSDGNRYKEVLCSLLMLNKAQGLDYVPCQLKIIYGSWTNKNELEKKFVFFIVCREDEFTEKSYQQGLWKQINNNMHQWLDLLPLEKRALFTETRQSGVYAFNRKNVQLTKQCKLAFVMDKDCKSILEFDVPIILISKAIYQRGDSCFETKLSRHPKTPELFHFSFKPSKKYFIFDPEEYSQGFERQIELPELVIERNNFDDQRKQEYTFHTEDLATKLERLLTRGTFKFDKRLWPLLVLSKPNEEQKMNEKWIESMSFIKRIQFTAVFDFDDFSNKNGLCCLHRNPERSAIYTERLFHENAGNLQELANKLGLPYDDKTLWIFANGQHDSLENKPHLSRSGWHGCYSAGVCDAVSFFNQTFVIPKGRAVILVLLFSHDYDGVIDTFNEITRNFGWDPLVIVAEHKRTFDDFAETILKEGKGNKEDLEKVSVIGMPWEHVNNTVTSLTGYDEKLNCVLPCSSGAQVPAEERFVETLADLSILSAKQCEFKKFKNVKTRRQFAREQELQFYKGQEVTWWNFYFENHVCLRNRYVTLQQKAQTLLSHAKEETRKVVPLIIAHEPGAGATTLGHQLLWHFRQKYRCCVIQKLSEMTIMHVLSLWKYKEDERSESPPNPIVLLLDEIVQTQLSLSEFTRQLNIEFRKTEFNNGMNCLIIVCQREEKLSDYCYESQNVFYLKQELNDKEKTWFTDKFDELERTGRELDLDEYKPQHLISFMIMRFEFNPEYIKNTIQHFISTIDQTSNEYKLLKYVSFLATYTPLTRRGVKVFVPLECCDELMGCKQWRKQRFWEDHLSSPLKVLLIIEEKELASGRQVRIAHPSLGKVILCEIMNREKAHLADIAKEYLSCSLLQSISYGKKLLVDFTLEMLKRRKKEEYDDEKTTKFSPLIEEIKGDSANNYGEAAEILKIGFEKFNDYMLAQALARLYSEWKQYDEAIKWAKEAVDLSSKSSLSYILHTYGLVLREKFRHLTAKNTFYPERVHEYLELILDSLDVFLRAQRERDDETDTQKLLYPFHDAIHTINEITKFLTENIIYVMDKKDLIRYLKEKDYIPDEISTVWSSFHARLKQMREQAHNAFKVLEDNVCFNTTFYAPEEVLRYTSQKMKEHRFYRSFHYGHENMLEKFTRIYGEPDPPVDGATQAAKDSYHRGRLWTLKGNSYMNIFNHIKYSGNRLNLKDITNNLCEIKNHIVQIVSKDPNDLANQVCVNVALGIMGSSKRDSESSIIKTCQQIISVGTDKVPVFVRENPDSQFDNSLWDHARTEEKLKRLYGKITTSSDGSSTIIVFDNKYGEPIRISKIRGTNKGDKQFTKDIKAVSKGNAMFQGNRVQACSVTVKDNSIYFTGIVGAAMKNKVSYNSYNYKLKKDKSTGDTFNSDCECPAGKGLHGPAST
uniref:Uncharacterized protein n=1 Tax=Magallana gigas TaxID=29159 RepID=A0A8W8L374_MAGGI